ncbi:two-component system, OmpR family, response regulator TctD [Monaibacterium marinum]|uniref:Two-component system, OmpR family, response regulator TctD n=1 Tax=Pontivivens marinum TaxID=1690039 RepID=A0A2C9CVB1_9RHOB|nr:response regulator transcription factor [Monaibacterium marinum]SOH95150.1 two-component system, OmpR family, response regulator TctD [Monaibacterium marinum]
MRFLLIEDNPKLASAIVERLRLDGHAVDHADTLDAAHSCLAVARYDLMLLDIMLPDGDGRALLESQRQDTNRCPVIVITARSAVSDRVSLLDLGADDYITKPFDFSELEARCRAVLRRQGRATDNRISIAGTTLDSTAGELLFDGQVIALRNRELRLLEVFFKAPGQVFSKSHLIDRMFSLSDEASENAIEVYVARLRKRLDGSGTKIETVRGLGYRMVAV